MTVGFRLELFCARHPLFEMELPSSGDPKIELTKLAMGRRVNAECPVCKRGVIVRLARK